MNSIGFWLMERGNSGCSWPCDTAKESVWPNTHLGLWSNHHHHSFIHLSIKNRPSGAEKHNTTQCPRPGLEPGPLDPESSALTMRPPRLPINWPLIREQHTSLYMCISKTLIVALIRLITHRSVLRASQLTKSSQYILTAMTAPSVNDGMSSRIRENNLKQKTNNDKVNFNPGIHYYRNISFKFHVFVLTTSITCTSWCCLIAFIWMVTRLALREVLLECRNLIGFVLLRYMIGSKKPRHFFIQSDANKNQSRLARTRFPALFLSCVHLFWVLIGSLDSDYLSFDFTAQLKNRFTVSV